MDRSRLAKLLSLMDFRSLFLNYSGRLRSGWMFFIFSAAFMIWAMVSGGLLQTIANSVGGFSTSSLLFVSSVFSLMGAAGLGWTFGKWLDGVPPMVLGLSFTPRWLVHFMIGSITGTASLLLAVCIAWI